MQRLSSHAICSGVNCTAKGWESGTVPSGYLRSLPDSASVSRHCTVVVSHQLKIMQISACGQPHGATVLYALDADGNVWELRYWGGQPEWVFIGSPKASEKL